MFDKDNRQKLDRMGSRLKVWVESFQVAREFSRQCKRLHDEMEAEGQRPFWHIVSGETLQSLAQRYANLEKIAAELPSVVEQAKQLDAELDAMLVLLKKEQDGVSQCVLQLCDQWRGELAVAMNCARDADIIAARQKLPAMEAGLHLYADALRLFQQIDDMLITLRHSNETAGLESALLTQREVVAMGGLTREGIEYIKSLYKPLDELSRMPPPPQISEVTSTLGEIRSWGRALSITSEKYRDLYLRLQQLQTSWMRRDPNEPDQLLQDARILLNEHIQQGHQEREANLSRLQNSLSELTLACGPQQEIETRLQSLKHTRLEYSHDFVDWMERYTNAIEEFKAIASTHELALEKRLEERCAKWRLGLQNLQAMPLSQSLKPQAGRLQQRFDKLNDSKGGQELLVSLREANDCLAELEQLNRQAEADRAGFDLARRGLREGNAALQASAATAEIDCDDLQVDIDALGENASNPDLDEVLAEAQSLQRRLESIRQRFISDCQAAWHQIHAEAKSLRDELLQAGFAELAASPAVDAMPTDAAECASRLVDLRTLRKGLGEAVEQAVAKLQENCAKAQTRLSGLLAGETLEDAYRERAQALLGQLQQGITAKTGPDSLRELSWKFNSCGQFWRDFLEEEEKLRKRLEGLKDKLNLFGQERLLPYCDREHLDKATDWIRGLPQSPNRTHARQLHDAERLVHTIEKQARRRVAEKVSQQALELAQKKHLHPNTDEMAALLAEIDGIGHEKHLPWELRNRLDAAITTTRSQHG